MTIFNRKAAPDLKLGLAKEQPKPRDPLPELAPADRVRIMFNGLPPEEKLRALSHMISGIDDTEILGELSKKLHDHHEWVYRTSLTEPVHGA